MGQARYFADGAGPGVDRLNWGNSLILNIHGDLSIGMWIKLPNNSVGTIMRRGGQGITGPVGKAYSLVIKGVSGAWDIWYLHDFSPPFGPEWADGHTFDANLPNDTWLYLGLSRDSTAKTVKLWKAINGIFTLIETWAYTTNPTGGTDVGCLLTVGDQDGNEGWGDGPGRLYVAEHYIWSRKLTQAEHFSAMMGSPSPTNLELKCLMGANPEVDLSVNGFTGILTGTTLGPGHSTPVFGNGLMLGVG